MNLSNKLTVLRMVLIPFVLAFMFQMPGYWGVFAQLWNRFQTRYGMIIALIFFIAASLTDFLDGHLARKNAWVTDFGKFLDPIADKLLVLSVLIAFAGLGRLSTLIAILTLGRDFMVTGVRLMAAHQGVVIAASMGGKVKTTVQLLGLIFCFIHAILLQMLQFYPISTIVLRGCNVLYVILIWASVVLALKTCWDYLSKGWIYIREGAR